MMKKNGFAVIFVLCIFLIGCRQDGITDNSESVNSEEHSFTVSVADNESESEDKEYEEAQLEWEGDKAEVSAYYLYRIDEEKSFVIDYTTEEYLNLIIKAESNEIEIGGNYITLTKAYLLQTDSGYFLLLETDENYDMDEKLWLFEIKDGQVTQCGEPILAKLDHTFLWSYENIRCHEIVNILDRMTEAEYAACAYDSIYQRKYYKIANGQLVAVEELTETEVIKTDLHTYKATMFRNAETEEVVRWEMEIYDGDTLLQTIYYGHDENVSCIPDLDKLIWEEDVNFDGAKDILIWQGHYGTHGDLGYRCYLADADRGLYELCPEFQEIPNPKVDGTQKLICGWNRSGATYEDTFYCYDGHTFVLARRDIYVWDEASNQYQQICSLDANVAVYTENDYVLVGTFEGTSGREYSFNIYTSMDGVGECVDIGNIVEIPADESEQPWNYMLLYKISEGQYFVFDDKEMKPYYLFAELQNDTWTIQIRDKDGNVLDTLTQTWHYEY